MKKSTWLKLILGIGLLLLPQRSSQRPKQEDKK